jgi:hypothetical protein
MKVLIIKSLEVICYIGFFGFILGGALATHYQTVSATGDAVRTAVALVIGAVIGFIVAVVVFGFLFLVLDIADNTRRAREVLERRP